MVKNKLIFVHIPKTGGTAIETAMIHESLQHHNEHGERFRNIEKHNLKKYFPPNGDPHASLKQIKKVINVSEYTIFTVLRNPWDRFVSFYRYHNKLSNKKQSIRQYYNSKYNTFKRYSPEKMLDKTDNIIYLKQETLQDDFSNMLESLGLEDIKLPRVNVTSNKTDYRRYLQGQDGIIKQIEKDSQFEIKMFGYKY